MPSGWLNRLVVLAILATATARPAAGMGTEVTAATGTGAQGVTCSQTFVDGAASCASTDTQGVAQAGADPSFNGGVAIEFSTFADVLRPYESLIAISQRYVNFSPVPQPVMATSILLPGSVSVFGEGQVQILVALVLTNLTVRGRHFVASRTAMFGSMDGTATWINDDTPGDDFIGGQFVLGAAGIPDSTPSAGVPSNWPQTGPVASQVDLPFSVLGFDLGTVGPGEEFVLQYLLQVAGAGLAGATFVEFVQGNIGDPLNLGDTPFFELDPSVFAEVPEPALPLLLAGACLALARRATSSRPSRAIEGSPRWEASPR